MKINTRHPPGWALQFLHLICPTHLSEEIEGDLLQEFERDIRRFGEKRARREFTWNVVRYLRPRIILRNHFSIDLNHVAMLSSYLTIGLRYLKKQKVYASISFLGLSVGIACFSLILLFATSEFSFDTFHKNASDIYRAYIQWENLEKGQPPIAYTDYSGPTSATLGEAMRHDLPDVADFVRLQLPWGENLIRTDSNVLRAAVSFADQSLFSIFTFPLKRGNTATVFRNLNDLVLTESRANALFGTDDVVGRTVEIQLGTTFQQFKICAVTRDIPSTSSVRFDVLANYLYVKDMDSPFIIGNNWHPTVRQTFVQLQPGSNLPGDSQRLSHFLLNFNPRVMLDLKNYGFEWDEKKPPIEFKLQSLLSIHTDTDFHGWSFTDYQRIDKKTIWILLAIATGVLLIACINFTTLAIGRSAGRSKEVGVRKVIGARKRQVAFQFLAEAEMVSAAATAFGLLFAYLLLPWFNQLSGRNLHFDILLHPQLIVLVIVIILVVGLIAGSYPAFVLSTFKPVDVLKNKIRIGGSNLFTKSLVTFQFGLSIMLIISTIIILQQSTYMMDTYPGFNKENVVVVDASETDPNKIYPAFRESIINQTSIVGVTTATAGLGAGHDLLGYSNQGLTVAVNIVDADYISVLGMKLIAGKNFEPTSSTDTLRPIVINETMMKAFSWTAQSAIGQELDFQFKKARVIGVVNNFNFRPLSESVRNQAFITSNDKGYSQIYVRIRLGNPRDAMDVIQKAWNTVSPDIPLKYSFLDEDINNYYRDEQRWTGMVGWAGGISIFLACLGLLGLTALTAVNRTKEIGLRKVMGASIQNIISLLLGDFLKLVLIAFLVASPFAWYFMNEWLQHYANRISISWIVFLLVGIATTSIALLTIGFHAVKAALANPVNSLRLE
jgi:putative ABC transport system permease protein